MVDPVSDVKTLLTNGWNNSNTDSITPTIDFRQNHRQLELRNKDYVLLYHTSEDNKPFNLGGTEFDEDNIVSIEIRTTYKNSALSNVRAHLIKMKDEVKRLIKANIDDPSATFKQLLLIRSKDLSHKTPGSGKWIFDVSIRRWGT